MPNPRYLTEKGVAQVELLKKLSWAKEIYFSNLYAFCKKHFFDSRDLGAISKVFLIGSHAEERKWNNDTSDLDLKLVNSRAIPENLWRFKREVLDPILCNPKVDKKYWIDIYFAREIYQVTHPRWDITKYWEEEI